MVNLAGCQIIIPRETMSVLLGAENGISYMKEFVKLYL